MASRRSIRCVLLSVFVATVGATLPAAGAATSAAGRLSGRVQDAATGAAVANAELILSDPASHTTVTRTTADSSGAYAVAVPQGTYDVAVSVSDGPTPAQGLMKGVAVKADSHLTIALVAPATGTTAPTVKVTGTLQDRDHHAVASARLTLYSLATSYVSATTGADGAFTFRVPAGHYMLLMSSSGQPIAGAAVPHGSFDLSVADVDLSADRRLDLLLPAVDLTVTVRDRSGGTVANAYVTAYGGFNNGTPDRTFAVAPGLDAGGQWSGNGKTDASGRLVLPGFPTDSVRFSVSPPGGPSFLQTGNSLPASAAIDVTLPPTATLRGVVHDFDGAPLPGVSVGVFSSDTNNNGVLIGGSTIAGSDGAYSLTVPTGSYTFNISRTYSPDGRGRNDTYSVNLGALELTADRVQDLTMPGRTVAVHVTDPSGTPVAGALVSARAESSTGGIAGWRSSRRSTDSSGNAELIVFPGATATVNASPPNGSTLASTAPRTLGANEAGPVTLALRATVTLTGHAIVGAPAAGVQVYLVDGSSNSFLADTAADGSYTLHAPAGTYSTLTLHVCCSAGSNPAGPNQLDLTAGPLTVTGNQTLDLTPPTVQITARSYDPSGTAWPLDAGSSSSSRTDATVALSPGLEAHSVSASTDVRGAGAKQLSLTLLPGTDWNVGLTGSDPSGGAGHPVSATNLRFAGDSDLAIVETAAGSSTTPTTTTTTTTPTTPGSPPGDGAGSTSGSGGGGTPGATPTARSGYWMVTADGEVHAFGDAEHYGDPHGTLGKATAAHLEPTPGSNGYWILDSTGRVHTYGDAAPLGDATSASLAAGEKPASLSATPSGKGYWIFTSRGRVLTFGDASFYGDMSKTKLSGSVLGSVATPSGKGYYMVASDGGIFTFGDAAFHGSTGNLRLNKPVMGMAPADNGGYWLVASDGGIFAFDVPFHGSMGATRLNKPISGLVPGHDGYLMVAEDGGIFSFGDVAFHGSLGGQPPASPVISAALLR